MQKYVEEAMESYDSGEDEENTVFEEFLPDWFFIAFFYLWFFKLDLC